MPRNSSYDEDVAQNLRKGGKAGVREFLLGLTEGDDGIPLEQALAHTITRMGIKEFCDLANVPMSNVSQFIRGKRPLKPETLNKWMKPFGLRARLTLVKAS